MCKLFSFVFGASLFVHAATAQILQVSPLFPTRNEPITISYNAALGNAALVGVTPVYAHTGLITTLSVSDTNWFNTQGIWGTADPHVLMTGIGNNKFTISFTIDSFYSAPDSDAVEDLAFVFRNTDGSIVGRNADGSNILLAVYAPVFMPVLSVFIRAPMFSPSILPLIFLRALIVIAA